MLTPANVGTATFGPLQKVTLDDQVDAQPLVVPGMLITAGNYQGTHDVAYVADGKQFGICHRRSHRHRAIEPEFRNARIVSLGMQQQRPECRDQLDAR